jgi:hypothetical protein
VHLLHHVALAKGHERVLPQEAKNALQRIPRL